jgi:hypothetical protein
LFDLISQVLEESLGFLVQVAAESILPGINPTLKATLNALGLEGKSTNLMHGFNSVNLISDTIELSELLLEVLELRVLLVEGLKSLFSTLSPEP